MRTWHSTSAAVVQNRLTSTFRERAREIAVADRSARGTSSSTSRPDSRWSTFRERAREIAVADRSMAVRHPPARQSQTSAAPRRYRNRAPVLGQPAPRPRGPEPTRCGPAPRALVSPCPEGTDLPVSHARRPGGRSGCAGAVSAAVTRTRLMTSRTTGSWSFATDDDRWTSPSPSRVSPPVTTGSGVNRQQAKRRLSPCTRTYVRVR